MTDLSRYADWTAWLTEQAAVDPDVHCLWVSGSAATGGYDEWSDLDVDVLCTPGRSACGLRPVAGAGPCRLRRAQRVGGPRARLAGRTPVLPEPAGPPRPPPRADPHRRPARLRPVRQALAPRRTPARHPDRPARPRRAHRPRGGGRQGRPPGCRRPGQAAAGHRRVAGQPRDRARPRRRGDRLLPELRSKTLVRLLRVEHCPWRHDFGLRYLRADLPADIADRVEELVPGATSASLEELSLRCFAWIDELLGSPRWDGP